MNRLTYEIYDGALYLTDFFGDESEECDILVKECADAAFSIGSKSLKLKNGAGRVNLSAIKKGCYLPTLILKDKTLSGGELEVGGTAVKVLPVFDAAKRETRELSLLKRLDAAERKISALNYSVYGTTIF